MHIDYSENWHTIFRDHMLKVISLDKEKPDFYELDISIHMQTMWKLLAEHFPLQAVSPHLISQSMNVSVKSSRI